jgi:hypothetical protein
MSNLHEKIVLSLLGPDDFDLDRKGRKKKLAKDLPPEMQKQIERWLDKMDEDEVLDRLSELYGPEQARLLLLKLKKKRLG